MMTPMMSHGPCGALMLDAAFTLDGLPTSELLVGTGSWGGPWGPYTCGPLLGEGAGGKGLGAEDTSYGPSAGNRPSCVRVPSQQEGRTC